MITIFDILCETIFFREQMPQIDASGIKSLMKSIKAEGVSYKEIEVKVGDLKPSQKDIDHHNVNKFVGEIKESGYDGFPPIVISRDMYILDGHHRTVAMQECNTDSTIKAYQIQEDVLAAFEVFNKCVADIEVDNGV